MASMNYSCMSAMDIGKAHGETILGGLSILDSWHDAYHRGPNVHWGPLKVFVKDALRISARRDAKNAASPP